jgi:DNA helicase HerA-like ATPase
MVGGAPASLELRLLPKHTAIFAGSGSGKTVLIRRMVEECALHGISAIVLDPNNDLARLGDAWPETPETWIGDDAAQAREYLDRTDVVVWTPGRQGGRPLVFQPLPAFADIIDSPDEFDAAVYAAVDALTPRVNANKGTDRARLEKAVLTEALKYFGRNGGSSLGEFIALLNALPQDASTLAKAPGVAADLAEKLEVARISDPLFGGVGQSADPGILLIPPAGKRARVSVISMIGLTGDEQRQSFVNQLQMALFSWVKRHPAGGDTPSGLFVMDEAQTLAPSSGSTPSTQSSIQLASQARKYGLGLVFATQAPRGLHNRISGNATTQFFGRLNHPAQIESARDLARAKGGDIRDVGGLGTGVFYLATENRGFHKIRTPMCLSHHPPSPLTEEEVIARAQRQNNR